jgi:hypothetical protein
MTRLAITTWHNIAKNEKGCHTGSGGFTTPGPGRRATGQPAHPHPQRVSRPVPASPDAAVQKGGRPATPLGGWRTPAVLGSTHEPGGEPPDGTRRQCPIIEPMPPDTPSTDIQPGLTTLHRWATTHGRTPDYVRIFWRTRPGFPDPAGTLPARSSRA